MNQKVRKKKISASHSSGCRAVVAPYRVGVGKRGERQLHEILKARSMREELLAAVVLAGALAVALLMYARTNAKRAHQTSEAEEEPSSGQGVAEAMLQRHDKAQAKLTAGARRTRRLSRDSISSEDDISYKTTSPR